MAQNKIWDKTIGGNSFDRLTDCQPTNDGGYILGGSSESGKGGDKTVGSNGYDYWIVKLNADGSKAWDKTFGGKNDDRLNSLQQTSDGGYILGGFSYSDADGDKSEANNGGLDANGVPTSDYWVIKLDAEGNKVWDKTIGGNSNDGLSTLVQTPDGSYLLGGSSASNKSGDKTEDYRDTGTDQIKNDFWVVKLNANGTKVWDKTLGGNKTDNLASLVITTDGDIILGGTSYSGKSGDKTEASKGAADYWAVKLKADGTKIWDKTIGGNKADVLVSLQPTENGGYVLGGTSESGISGDKTEPKLSPADIWIVKLNADGAKVWDKTNSGSYGANARTFNITQDGGYLVGGWYELPGSSTSFYGDADFWLLKFDGAGTKVWEKTLGGKGSDRLEVVRQTPDGNYLVAGSSDSGISGDKSEKNRGSFEDFFDYWVLKLDNKGTIIFDPVTDKTFGDDPFTLSAKASTGAPVSFTIISGPATIKNNTITLTGVGTVTVKASLAGNASAQPTATLTFIVNAPSSVQKLWDKTLGADAKDALTALVRTPDGGYLLGGTSLSGKNGDKSQESKGKEDYWLVRTDKAGTKLWDKTLGGTGTDLLTSLIASPDGGYLVGGYSKSDISGDKTQASQGDMDYWVVKIDENGNKLWDKTYGGNKVDNLTALVATNNGGYLLGGTSMSNKSGDKSEENKRGPEAINRNSTDYWVIQLDAAGNKLWDKTYGGGTNDNLTALLATGNGDILLGGYSASGISADKSQATRGIEDYWVLRINSQGAKIWDKTFGGVKDSYISWYSGNPIEFGSSFLSALAPTPDGGFLLGGSSNAEKGAEKSEGNLIIEEPRFDANVNDYWVVKIDGNGTRVWDKTYGGISTYVYLPNSGQDPYYTGNSTLSAIVATSEGNYLLAGSSNSEAGNDKSQDSKGGQDYWIVKIDNMGSKVWEQTIGGTRSDNLTKAIVDTEGNFLLGGSSNSGFGRDKSDKLRDFDPNNVFSGGDYWLVKIQDETTPATTTWNMRYGGAGTDHFTDVIKTTDGGYLSAGYTNSGVSGDKTQSSQGQNDYWLVKADKNGKKVWEKRFGGAGEDYLNRVIQTQDGGYLLAGSSLSGQSGDKSQASQGERDYWVVKTDPQGNKQWDKVFGGAGSDELKKVVQLASGEYVLGGYSNSPVSGDKTQPSQGGQDYWLVKISRTGTKLWDQRYGGTANDALSSFTTTDNGGFLLSGTSLSGQNGDKSQNSVGGSDYWVVRTDQAGNLVWDKTFGGSGADEAYSVGRSGSDYWVAGTSQSGKSGSKSQASRGGKDYWVVKINSSGTPVWDRTFGGEKDDELRASTMSKEGYFVLAGSSNSALSGDKSQGSQGSSDYWVVAVDQAGNKVYDQRYGGSGAEELRTVTSAQDGGLLLGGRSSSGVSGDKSQPSQGNTDYWLIKISPASGNAVAARVATPPETSTPAAWQAYPNPFQEKATIRFSLPETQATTVKVYDSQGREVSTLFNGEVKANQLYEVQWQATNQAAGLYILQLQTPTKKQQQKLLLTK